MALTSSELRVIISAQNNSQQAFAQLTQSLNGLRTLALGVGTALAGGLASMNTISIMRRVGDEVDSLRDSLGLTAVEASHLNFAARAVGTSAEEVSAAFGALNRKIIDQIPLIATGESDFQKWGVAVQNARGEILQLPQVLENVSKRMRELPAGFERSGLAMDLMGRSGRQLLDLMTLSDTEMQKLARQAEEMGLVFSEAGVDSLEGFNREMNLLALQFDGLVMQIGSFMLPVLRGLLSWLRQNQGAIKGFFEEVRKAWGFVKQFAAAIQAFVGHAKEKGLVGALVDEARAMFPELAKIWDEWFAPGEGKIPKFFDAAGTKAHEIFGEGGVIGRNFDELGTSMQRIWGPGGTVGQAFSDFGTGVKGVFDGIGTAIREAFNSVLRAIETTVNNAIEVLNTLIRAMNLIPGVNIPLVSKIKLWIDEGTWNQVHKDIGELQRDRRLRITVELDSSEAQRELNRLGRFAPGGAGGPPAPVNPGEGRGGDGGSSDRPATLDDIYAAYARNHGSMPDWEYAKSILATGPMWSAVQNLAGGGIVRARPGGTLARIGEGGQDEAVIPLPRAGMGSVSIGSIVIEGNVDSSDRVRELADEVSNRILRAISGSGNVWARRGGVV